MDSRATDAIFEVLSRLKAPDKQVEVLETGRTPLADATRDNAKVMLVERLDDPRYGLEHYKVRPEGVRFLDDAGHELARYTVDDYLEEGGQLTDG